MTPQEKLEKARKENLKLKEERKYLIKRLRDIKNEKEYLEKMIEERLSK